MKKVLLGSFKDISVPFFYVRRSFTVLDIKQNIEQRQIIKGMNTFQAGLAGGAYFFRVIADPDIWEKDIDPNIVIRVQVNKPDNSQIWMTFQNNTQYKEKGKQTFQVTFEQGKVIDVTKITGGK